MLRCNSSVSASQLERIGDVDWKGVAEAYRSAKRAGKQGSVQLMKIAGAVAYMINVEHMKMIAVAAEFGQSRGWAYRHLALHLLDPEAQGLLNAELPVEKRLTLDDAQLIISGSPAGTHLERARRLVALKNSKKKAHYYK